MARLELSTLDNAALGVGYISEDISICPSLPQVSEDEARVSNSGDMFFQLGMMYSTGRSVPTDRVAAHKWFNLAAMRGSEDAKQYRKEIAAEMSEEEISLAQKAARAWLASS
jgi:uncharacterized protein